MKKENKIPGKATTPLWGNFFQAGQISPTRDGKQTGSRIPRFYSLGLHLHQFNKAKDKPAIISQVKSSKKGGVEASMNKVNNELQKDTIVTTEPRTKDREGKTQPNFTKTRGAPLPGLLGVPGKSNIFNVNDGTESSRSTSGEFQGVGVETINKLEPSTERGRVRMNSSDKLKVSSTSQKNKILKQVEKEKSNTINKKENDDNLNAGPKEKRRQKLRVGTGLQMKRVSSGKRLQSALFNSHKSSQDIIENREIQPRRLGLEAQRVDKIFPISLSESEKKVEEATGKYIPIQEPQPEIVKEENYTKNMPTSTSEVNPARKFGRALLDRGHYLTRQVDRAEAKNLLLQRVEHRVPPLSSFKELSSWIRKAEATLNQINELLPLLTREAEKAKKNLEPSRNFQKPARIISENKNMKGPQSSARRDYSNYLARNYQGNFYLGI